MRLVENVWFEVFLALAIIAGGVTAYNQLKETAYIGSARGGSAQPPPKATSAATPPAKKIVIPYDPNWPSIGSKVAPLVLVEFEDYECPFCRRFRKDTLDKIWDTVDDGRVRFITRDLPLSMHPNALKAAVAARCAKPFGKYWLVREALYAEPDLSGNVIARVTKEQGLEMTAYSSCQNDQLMEASIVDEAASMNKLGIEVTPTFVLGRVKNNSIEGVKIIGAVPYSEFESRIKEVLASP
jgi:protein-disulfide isomerase